MGRMRKKELTCAIANQVICVLMCNPKAVFKRFTKSENEQIVIEIVTAIFACLTNGHILEIK
jgi:hypothetical protein